MTTVDLTGVGLIDSFNRPITYLRISVTDKCNLRCVYCMPESGLPWLRRDEVLRYEEIIELVRAAAIVGIQTIRITGGEPLIRRDLYRLIEGIARVEGIQDIALSTNAILLEEQLDGLMRSGLKRVNISLDTLRADRFERIARRPGLASVMRGIDAAIAQGLFPIKLNCVVMRGQNDDEIADFARLTLDRPIMVRFIEVMPVCENVKLQRDSYVGSDEILERIAAVGAIKAVRGPAGTGPARYFSFDGVPGAVGLISPLSHDFCERCNRVRLSADGKLRLCLFGEPSIDLRAKIRGGASTDEIADILRFSMSIKPERHHLQLGDPSSRLRAFSEIGG